MNNSCYLIILSIIIVVSLIDRNEITKQHEKLEIYEGLPLYPFNGTIPPIDWNGFNYDIKWVERTTNGKLYAFPKYIKRINKIELN